MPTEVRQRLWNASKKSNNSHSDITGAVLNTIPEKCHGSFSEINENTDSPDKVSR